MDKVRMILTEAILNQSMNALKNMKGYINMWIYSIVAAIVISFFGGWYINGLRLNAEIAQLHATWNEAYANQAKITMDKEHVLNQLNTQIEVNNATKEKAINTEHDENIKLADTVKRLQQPTSARSSTMPKTGTTCKCAGATTTTELSGESINLLVQMAKDADDAARYANTCHDWAIGVIQELN
jgi:hypothetical protein